MGPLVGGEAVAVTAAAPSARKIDARGPMRQTRRRTSQKINHVGRARQPLHSQQKEFN